MQYAPNIAWVNSPFIVLIRTSDKQAKQGGDESEQLRSDLGIFLKKLRYLSGQSDMPKQEDLLLMMSHDIDILPQFVAIDDIRGLSHIQTYPLTVAITQANLEAAAELPDEFSTPIHSLLILDAISALLASEHRISILFAAMSMEIGFGTVLDEAYKAILLRPGDPRYRVLKIPICGGEFVTKDPVYDRLRGRDDFSTRMHEMSLYVLGKSLREENQDLYNNALILYRSRNKIVHLGTTEDAKEKVLSVDGEGSRTAIQTATDCLTWLGLNHGVKLPKLQFLSGDAFREFAKSLDA